jgi:hypothetical protein
MAKEKMTLKAYDWDTATSSLTKTPKNCTYEMPHTEENTGGGPVKSYGMPITVKAYQEMIKRYMEAAEIDPTIFSKLVNVTFSKSSVFRILSQEGCEAVRIWQAIPNSDGKVSLVLEGLDKDHNPIKMDRVLRTSEAGGSARLHDHEDPLYEERGNGEEEGVPGFLKSVTPAKLNSQSLSDFMAEMFTALSKK